jgi:hypothetical protein
MPRKRERRWRADTDVKGENPSKLGQKTEILTGLIYLFFRLPSANIQAFLRKYINLKK